MNSNAAVVFDQSQLAKPVHKEADPRPRRADHLRQRLLRNLRNQHLRFAGLAKLRHQQQNPRPSPALARKAAVSNLGWFNSLIHMASFHSRLHLIGAGLSCRLYARDNRDPEIRRRVGFNCRLNPALLVYSPSHRAVLWTVLFCSLLLPLSHKPHKRNIPFYAEYHQAHMELPSFP